MEADQRGWLRCYAPDLLLVAAFFAFGFLWQASLRGWQPDYFGLYEDAARYTAIAAAQDHPENFAQDNVMGNPRTLADLPVLMFPLIRAAQRLTGDYGSAMAWLLGPHAGLMLSGFYILGRVLFRSRFWALVLAILNLVPVRTGFATHWGIINFPLPRVTFSALIPFLWAALLAYKHTMRLQVLLILACIFLVYVHPINALPAAFGIWLALRGSDLSLKRAPASWCFRLAIGILFIMGSLLLLKPLFAQAVVHKSEMVDSAGVYGLLGAYPLTAETLLVFPRAMWRTGTAGFYLFGGICAWFLLRKKFPDRLRMILMWCVGTILASWVFPLLLKVLLDRQGTMSFHLEMLRAVRQTVPLFLVLSVWGLASLPAKKSGTAFVCLALALSGLWFWKNGGDTFVQLPLHAKRQRQNLEAINAGVAQRRDGIVALRELTPPDARILPFDIDPMPVRYGALRSVAYAERDGLLLAVAGRETLLRQRDNLRIQKELESLPWGEKKMRRLREWARSVDAGFLYLPGKGPEEVPGLRRLLGNGAFQLFAVE